MLGDDGKSQSVIRTFPRRGFRFVAEVTALDEDLGLRKDAVLRAPTEPTTQQSPKPVIAVLPFDNLSADVEQQYFADGISEDIITALTKHRWLMVVARNSSFSFRGHSSDIRQVARELGSDYLVEGSVRKLGDRVRITAQLIHGTTGAHIWAHNYDLSLIHI